MKDLKSYVQGILTFRNCNDSPQKVKISYSKQIALQFRFKFLSWFKFLTDLISSGSELRSFNAATLTAWCPNETVFVLELLITTCS